MFTNLTTKLDWTLAGPMDLLAGALGHQLAHHPGLEAEDPETKMDAGGLVGELGIVAVRPALEAHLARTTRWAPLVIASGGFRAAAHGWRAIAAGLWDSQAAALWYTNRLAAALASHAADAGDLHSWASSQHYAAAPRAAGAGAKENHLAAAQLHQLAANIHEALAQHHAEAVGAALAPSLRRHLHYAAAGLHHSTAGFAERLAVLYLKSKGS